VWLVGDEWARYFVDFERSAFRLETLPQYLVTAEETDYRSFLAGAPMPSDYNSDWHDRLTANRATGRIVQRVRVLRGPLTDYQRFQFEWGYPGNVAAGEDIHILDLAEHTGLNLSEADFWLFDEITVVEMRYEPDGRQIGRWLNRDADVSRFIECRDLALAHATPFREYRTTQAG
jgi:hypothetical protein